jgi:hypothetical protein
MKTIKERFDSKYIIDSNTGCWNWMSSKKPSGYGTFSIGYRTFHAHRMSFELYKGPIPSMFCVCHKCDNPSCVNPEHLFLGTHRQNSQDMVDKKRQARGERSGTVKLTEEQVIEIKSTYKRRHGQLTELARKYNVTTQAIWKIVRHKNWLYLDNE